MFDFYVLLIQKIWFTAPSVKFHPHKSRNVCPIKIFEAMYLRVWVGESPRATFIPWGEGAFPYPDPAKYTSKNLTPAYIPELIMPNPHR
jgi:hypothetical protein